MKLTTKLGVTYALLTALLVISSAVALNGNNSLNDMLDFITGRAWDAADGAMEGTIGVEAEVIAIERMMAGRLASDQAQKQIAEASSQAKEAFGRMEASGLVATEDVQAFVQQRTAFQSARANVLNAYIQHVASHASLEHAFNDLTQFMALVEEVADGAVEMLEQNPNTPYSWHEGLSERWSAADGSMELRIAILEHRFAYQRLMDEPSNTAHESTLITWSDEAKSLLNEISSLQAFQTTVPSGPYQGTVFSITLRKLISEYLQKYDKAKQEFLVFSHHFDHYEEEAAHLLAQVEEIEEKGDQAVEGVTEQVAALQSSTRFALFASLAVGLLVAIGAVIYSMQAVAAPIARVAKALQHIGEKGGDLTVQLSVKGNDELSLLAEGFNSFVARIRSIVMEVSNATAQLGHTAHDLQDAMLKSNSAINVQLTETEQVATAVEEMTATAQEVARNTSSTADSAQHADEQTRKGNDIILETINAVRRAAEEVERATNAIDRLRERSESIGSVVDVINGIADQTNLLALNAAIEAARAGEQGRGFAVVAEEVRNLAIKTQDSTEEIRKMVEKLQADTNDASNIMDSGHSLASESVERTGSANEALDAISNAVATINGMSTQIATAVEAQSSVSAEVSRKITHIRDQAEDNMGNIHHMTDSVNTLASMAKQLQAQVDQFQTE